MPTTDVPTRVEAISVLVLTDTDIAIPLESRTVKVSEIRLCTGLFRM